MPPALSSSHTPTATAASSSITTTGGSGSSASPSPHYKIMNIQFPNSVTKNVIQPLTLLPPHLKLISTAFQVRLMVLSESVDEGGEVQGSIDVEEESEEEKGSDDEEGGGSGEGDGGVDAHGDEYER
jgi:hypothetical protein